MDWLSNDCLEVFIDKVYKGSFLLIRKEPFGYDIFYELTLSLVAKMLKELKQSDKRVRATKDNGKSTELRKQGNKVFEKSKGRTRDLIMALELYTKSIGYATSDSKELAIAYSTRAVLLFKMKRFAESLQDLERALELKFLVSDKTLLKIKMDKAQCLQQLAIQCYGDAQVWLSKIPLNDNTRSTLKQTLKVYPAKTNESFLEEQECVIPKIEHPNKRFPCASDAIDVNYSETFGRHVVATRDIETGEVLIVEKPYHNYLSEEMRYTYCNLCLKIMWAGIPCEHCVCSFYCSEECKILAWEKYHQFECKYIDLIHADDFRQFEECAVRVFSQALTEAGGLKELRERVEHLNLSSEKPVWPLKDEWYQSGSSLESIFSQVTNIGGADLTRLKACAVKIVRYTFLLACTTNLFGTRYNWNDLTDYQIVESMLKNGNVKFVGGQLIKLSFIVMINTQGLAEYADTVMKNKRLVWSFGVFLNYSCFHNTSMEYKRDCTVRYAAFPIKKGEQVFSKGEVQFTTNSLQERQEKSERDLYFTCTCIACKEDWPKFSEELKRNYKVKPGTTVKDEENFKKIFVPAIETTVKEVSVQLENNDLRQKDALLKELYCYVTWLYEKFELPNYLMMELSHLIEKVHYALGIPFMSYLLKDDPKKQLKF